MEKHPDDKLVAWGEKPAGLITETQAAVALAIDAERERCVQWLLDIAGVYRGVAEANKVDPAVDPVGFIMYRDGFNRYELLANLLRDNADPVQVFDAFMPRYPDDNHHLS